MMIEASFDRNSRHVAVSGVYQYDTGQRLRMNGLPSPDELLAGDDLLSGDLVTVQAHFGYEGDEQTDMSLAQWDDERWCWVADIPDVYLTRIDPVHVYVYVYYGRDGDTDRANTMYEGVFSPISRPAPNNIASDDMLEQWTELEAEVDLVLAPALASAENANEQTKAAKTAGSRAEEAARGAEEAAQDAEEADQALLSVEQRFAGLRVLGKSLSADAQATVRIENGSIIYGVPRGATGEKGETGDTGPADIALSVADGVLTITPK